MSAIAGVFRPAGPEPSDAVSLRRMLGAMRARGGDRVDVHASGGAMLGVARADWEMGADFSGGALVVVDGDVVVVADASLYYRDDLRRALAARGIPDAGAAASHLVLAAYRAWGGHLAEHLEGDFAFVIWDGAAERVVAARDFGGKRTLFHAQAGDTLIVASTVSGVLAHPECPRDLDAGAITATAAGLFAADRGTCYRSIERFPAGSTLCRAGAAAPRIERHWSPPVAAEAGGERFEHAAEALRELLVRAVRERCAREGETSVWLSGGWDSPAVFAAGMTQRAAGSRERRLQPVSMSYPVGDPGREDELIEAIAERWGTGVQWVRTSDARMFERVRERAAARDEPFAHAFEMWLRTLAGGSRAAGARVALDGMGGDQLFQVSNVYLADLLRSGRWGELLREAASRFGGPAASAARSRPARWRRIARGLSEWALEPQLPEAVARLLARVRGGREGSYLARPIPPWLDHGAARRYRLAQRERAFTPRRLRGSFAAYETHWYLTHPYFPMVFGCVAGIALEEGVEVRSPIYDRRIVEFALSRPRWERGSLAGTKLLLRKAMDGLLPVSVLAPRPTRTGVTSGYFARSMRESPEELSRVLSEDSLLARAGTIDARKAAGEWSRMRDGGATSFLGQLYLTLQAELWLRSRVPGGGDVTEAPIA